METKSPVDSRTDFGDESPPCRAPLTRPRRPAPRVDLRAERAVTLARTGDVDLVVMDIAMPQMTGLAAAREICRGADHPFVLMLSMYDNAQYFFQALKAGASGYVLKSVVDQDLVTACWAATRGESFQ